MSETEYHTCLACGKAYKTKSAVYTHFRFCKHKEEVSEDSTEDMENKFKLKSKQSVDSSSTTIKKLTNPDGTSIGGAMLMPLKENPDDLECKFISGIPGIPQNMAGPNCVTPPDSPRTLPFSPKKTSKSTLRTESASFGRMHNTAQPTVRNKVVIVEKPVTIPPSNLSLPPQPKPQPQPQPQPQQQQPQKTKSNSRKKEEVVPKAKPDPIMKSNSRKRESTKENVKELMVEIETQRHTIEWLQNENMRLTKELETLRKQTAPKQPVIPLHSIEPYVDSTFEVQLKKVKNEASATTEKYDEIRILFQKAWTQSGVFGLYSNSPNLFGSWIGEVWRNKFTRGDDFDCIYIQEDKYNKKLTPDMFKALIQSAIAELDSVDGNCKMILQQVETFASQIEDQTNGKKNAFNLFNRLFKRKDNDAWNEVFEGLVM